ncbi:hypothetical protein DFH07DRAFT_956788 [Mycena maculata]|uniref:Uncharacterized protein n=1 Tax=Mycena maculata TaxID=230809 RepID=A0AAD7JGV5_9AGAR|nr:hypothetical protein DFH07DRAFT_956788 [Mycena maculata]
MAVSRVFLKIEDLDVMSSDCQQFQCGIPLVLAAPSISSNSPPLPSALSARRRRMDKAACPRCPTLRNVTLSNGNVLLHLNQWDVVHFNEGAPTLHMRFSDVDMPTPTVYGGERQVEPRRSLSHTPRGTPPAHSLLVGPGTPPQQEQPQRGLSKFSCGSLALVLTPIEEAAEWSDYVESQRNQRTAPPASQQQSRHCAVTGYAQGVPLYIDGLVSPEYP